MNGLKRVVIMPYLLLCIAAVLHSLIHLLRNGQAPLAWYGAILAIAPMAGFMLYLGFAGVSRTSRYMPLQLFCAWLGTALALYQPAATPTTYTLVLGLIGVNAYVFWYSRLNRPEATGLLIGATLPAFSLSDSHGHVLNSDSLLGSPSLLLFYRGNWCPLCVSQVKEIAAQYRELQARGIQTVLISPQPAPQTRALAKRFDVPMRFAVDENGQVARKLDLYHPDAVPAGIKGYGKDSVYPTVILTNAENRVLWVDLSNNYRMRPEPAQYLAIFDRSAQSTPAAAGV